MHANSDASAKTTSTENNNRGFLSPEGAVETIQGRKE